MGTDSTSENQPTKEEYKGQMRLPIPTYEAMNSLCELTSNSLNSLVVQATDFFCALAEAKEGDIVPMPMGIVLARAAREHKERPKVISLAERYASIRPVSEPVSRAAEDEPRPRRAQARRAGGR